MRRQDDIELNTYRTGDDNDHDDSDAADKLGGIMDAKGVRSSHALRVFVKGGGCGGMQYGMTFDTPREADEVYEENGMRVIVDPTACSISTAPASTTWTT